MSRDRVKDEYWTPYFGENATKLLKITYVRTYEQTYVLILCLMFPVNFFSIEKRNIILGKRDKIMHANDT
jgi:hypothetical protein